MTNKSKILVSGKAPKSRRDTRVNFLLTYDGQVKASKLVTLLTSERNPAKRKAKLSSKEIEKLCNGFGQRSNN